MNVGLTSVGTPVLEVLRCWECGNWWGFEAGRGGASCPRCLAVERRSLIVKIENVRRSYRKILLRRKGGVS